MPNGPRRRGLPVARCGVGEAARRASLVQRPSHITAENPAATTKERRAAMGGSCPVVSAVRRTGVEQNVVEVQWNTRKRYFSTSPGSPHGPKETELVVLVRPAPGSRRSPTAIGDGVPEKKNHTRRRHLAKDGQRVKHSDRGSGWRSMVGNSRPPHAPLVALAWPSGRRWWLCVDPTT